MIEFTIFSLPDEEYEYNCAKNGSKYLSALQDFDNWINIELDHNKDLTSEEYLVIEKCRAKLLALCEEKDFPIWE